jgi:energy-coupling factor transporter ATP-binding protein EcfA2
LVNTGFVWLTPPAPCAGKSTLVKILSGIVKPDSGRIELNEVSFRPDSLMAVLGRHIDRRPGTQPAPTIRRCRSWSGASLAPASVKANERGAAEALAAFGAGDIGRYGSQSVAGAEAAHWDRARGQSPAAPAVFSITYPDAAIRWNYAAAFGCSVQAPFFAFNDWI